MRNINAELREYVEENAESLGVTVEQFVNHMRNTKGAASRAANVIGGRRRDKSGRPIPPVSVEDYARKLANNILGVSMKQAEADVWGD